MKDSVEGFRWLCIYGGFKDFARVEALKALRIGKLQRYCASEGFKDFAYVETLPVLHM